LRAPQPIRVVDEIGVLAKEPIELRHRRMVIRQNLGLESVECLLDRFRGNFITKFLFSVAPVSAARFAGS